MNIKLGLALLSLILSPLTLTLNAAEDNEGLAYYWAPVIYQDTDSTNYASDYITRFDYDEDFMGTNNWENLDGYPLSAYVYYWIIETETNYFIGYALFHPRDWFDVDNKFTSHENDLEGILLTIEKDGSYGNFLAMNTVAHLDFYSFTSPDSEVGEGGETIDGLVEFDGSHPNIYVEAKGHAIVGDINKEIPDFPGSWKFDPDGDYVVYHPDGIAGEPADGDDRDVSYELISIDELWERRYEGETFAEFGTFIGDTYGINKANAPWGWNDHDDGLIERGDFFLDPAKMVNYYYSNLGDFSLEYTHHPYLGS